MDARQESIARQCLEGAESNAMAFPQIVETLAGAGFESYAVDFRRALAVYYTTNGSSIELATHAATGAVAAVFNLAALQAAILDAQTSAPGYTYRGFCDRVVAGGCAGYIVSFPGRRAVYFGRTAETHVEMFPQ